MAIGANVAPEVKRGSRDYSQLYNQRAKMHTLAILFERHLKIETFEELEHKDREILVFVRDMREDKVMIRNGKRPLKAAGSYVKAFKAFWHWYQRVKRREGVDIRDVTIDLDAKDNKPKFNYLTIDDLKKLSNNVDFEFKVMLQFLFDSGMRAPKEFLNTKFGDLEWIEKDSTYKLNIREEVAKTFGRKIKLLVCSKILREYLSTKNFEKDEYIFKQEGLQH